MLHPDRARINSGALAPRPLRTTLLYPLQCRRRLLRREAAPLSRVFASTALADRDAHRLGDAAGRIFSPRAGEAAAGAVVFLFFPMSWPRVSTAGHATRL